MNRQQCLHEKLREAVVAAAAVDAAATAAVVAAHNLHRILRPLYSRLDHHTESYSDIHDQPYFFPNKANNFLSTPEGERNFPTSTHGTSQLLTAQEEAIVL